MIGELHIGRAGPKLRLTFLPTGPSGSVLINTGARFAGCQKYIANLTDIQWICLKDSNKASVSVQDGTCSMSEICGFGGFATPQEADQSFRFILPIFLHAGVVGCWLESRSRNRRRADSRSRRSISSSTSSRKSSVAQSSNDRWVPSSSCSSTSLPASSVSSLDQTSASSASRRSARVAQSSAPTPPSSCE